MNSILNTFHSFIKNSTAPYQVVEQSSLFLEEHGFMPLCLTDDWDLKKGGKYFVDIYGTTLFAFTVGKQLSKAPSLRLAAAHTDHPGFRVKPNSVMVQNGYLKLNTFCYGGAILNSWFDRPLSLAGRVCIKGKDSFHPESRLIDFKRPLLTIPNLAIHLNRDVNKGVSLNKQTDMLPIIALSEEKSLQDSWIEALLAEELSIAKEDILDYDLYIYNTEEGCPIGSGKDFYSAPRLDNLTSVYALLNGISQENEGEDIHMAALFDNEEIGSRTKQGADSEILEMFLEKLFRTLSLPAESLHHAIWKGLFFSVDVAHALHPNHAEKSDPTNPVVLGKGVVLKTDASQKYATDTEAISVFVSLCEEKGIPYQKFAGHSNQTGGSTLGSIASAKLPMRTADLGLPLLAMHSARELMGARDLESLIRLMEVFYTA